MDRGKLIYNAARCKGCGLILQSVHRHDFRQHDCTKFIEGTDKKIHVSVDGGLDYCHRGYQAGTRPDQNYEELSMWDSKGGTF